MGELTLTKTRLQSGVWEGILRHADSSERPSLRVTYLEREIDGVDLTEAEGHWVVRIPVPLEAVSDGVQTLLIADAETGESLGSIPLLAGEPLSDDIRAEVDFLRAELDMLKKAFRRHCLETM